MKNLNGRLARLEQISPAAPPTLQVIWPDHAGPIMPAPGGSWAGLLQLRIVYDDPGDNNAESTNPTG